MADKKDKYLLGLTGSVGMGKSTAAKMFQVHGFAVWDADSVVHEIYSKGGEAAAPISELCPQAVKDGGVDRTILSQWLAGGEDRIGKLEKIVHPLVAAHRKKFIEEAKQAYLLFDIPLLFETNADKWLTSVAVVTTSPEIQKKRVMARTGMTEEKFNFILSRQMSDSEKRKRADHLIISDTLSTAEHCVNEIVKKIRDQMNA